MTDRHILPNIFICALIILKLASYILKRRFVKYGNFTSFQFMGSRDWFDAPEALKSEKKVHDSAN